MQHARLAGAADRMAIAASAACLVHCLALPLIIAALPVLSSVLAVPEAFHVWMIAVAIPISAVALIRTGSAAADRKTVSLAIVGLTGLVVGGLVAGSTRYEAGVTVCGASLLAAAHIRNGRHRRGCR